MKRLSRTEGEQAMILGVCGGLGKYLEVDPTVVRIGFALMSLMSFGALILVYIVMGFVMPKESSI